METFGQKFKRITVSALLSIAGFAQRNFLMLGFIAATLLIELTGVAVTSGKFYMTQPWLFFTFVAILCLISLYLPGHTPRFILFIAALSVHVVLDLIFIIVYDSTGTIFDFAMLNLRTDAMMIAESVPISFTYTFVSVLILALYCTFGAYYKKRVPAGSYKRVAVIVTTSLLVAVIAVDAFVIYFTNARKKTNDLSYKLSQTETGTYSNKGIIGNFADELAYGLWFSGIEVGDRNELEQFIYASTTQQTPLFGEASGYNVVTVLCESFEWFTFLADAERYPNGYAKHLLPIKDENGEELPAAFDEQSLSAALHELYPNLYRFYESDSTVILNNSHALEKTDISENKAIIGNYPLYEYINYSYPENSVPYSMPNIMKSLFDVESNSFHNGYKTFYNRDVHHTHALGFNSYTASEDMGYETDDTGSLGERNLDSEMIEMCKERMFPTDRRFNTFITTITQHGQYAYRENLEPYYEKMDALGILPYIEGDDNNNALRYYCAAGMDFDKAIGIMLDYLDENGLADNTLITLFGDHNSYYQGVSNYAKNIYSYSADNYSALYRVPVMIRVGSKSLGNPTIEKFTCLVDIYPTILDLLGVYTFKNLTYGVSAFSPESSILYSRAYDKFLTDKIYFNSLSNIIYSAPDVDDDYIENVRSRALTLLDKVSHVNRLFAADFFKGDGATTFYTRLESIQDP